ncbi:hypothetical protein [Deinococcus aestuarii]|uniref:hypothetical protein n=1 Tax=Deinococcus aestuarii TaxID=2774531 RepID=UPI001C0BB071|nr:hypothetical protein [Deinococcus aestuarii]
MSEDLTPDLVWRLARLAGLELPPERAADLVPLLQSVLEGDARIAALDLGPLSALGPPWPEERRG